MMQDERLECVVQLTKKGLWKEAYLYFCEHQQDYAPRERRLLREALQKRLTGRSPWRGPLLLAVFTLLFQLLTCGFIPNQIQDLCSFVGRWFRPYMYLATLAPLAVGVLLNVQLIFRCYRSLIATNRLLCLPIPWAGAAVVLAVSILLVGFQAWRAVPLVQDFPLVVRGEWAVATVTEEEQNRTVYNNALVRMGRQPEEEYDPVPWFSHPRWSDQQMPMMPGLFNSWVCDIHVDDTVCRMGQLQFDMTDYQPDVYPIQVEYLPHSRLILWISCGEAWE